MAQVKISVIIPNYNHAPYLKQRIDSVLNQTYQNFEIIILDDCSNDNSREVIETYRNYAKVTNIVFNERNSGNTFKQWQKGIGLAKGEYIWIAESDDYCERFFLEMTIQNLQKTESPLVFCQSYGVDEEGNIKMDYLNWTESIRNINWNEEFLMNGNDFIVKALLYKNAIPNASAVIFKKMSFNFNDVVMYKRCGDWLFWINILSRSNISYIPRRLNYFRSHFYTTRYLDTKYKYAQRIIEELAIKYRIFQLKLIHKKQFDKYLFETIDSLIPYFDYYKEICKQLNLPNVFLLQFLVRKIELKIKRLTFNYF